MTEERKILHDLVKKEANKLRKFATKDELSNLNLKILNSNNILRCIYGQITGNCLSTRAKELICRCCDDVYDTSEFQEDIFVNVLSASKKLIKPHDLIGSDYERIEHYVSPIEKFIDIENDNNIGILIDYLKGETEELNFV